MAPQLGHMSRQWFSLSWVLPHTSQLVLGAVEGDGARPVFFFTGFLAPTFLGTAEVFLITHDEG